MKADVPAVYYILNTCNNKMYIGQSRKVYTRFQQHYNALQGNYHSNILLQLEWNIYGVKAFEFGVLVTFPSFASRWRRFDIEKSFMRTYQTERLDFGYNRNLSVAYRYRKHKKEAAA